MSPKIDLSGTDGDPTVPEYFEHPEVGWLQYDPSTLWINDKRDGQRPLNSPIAMTGKFFGTKQPYVPSCSEPGEGNKGCPKWAGCPLKKWKHVGPGIVIIRKQNTVSMSKCTDYFETMRGGRPASQAHLGQEGWELATDRTTIDMLGRTAAFQSGKLTTDSTEAQVKAVRASVSQVEVGGLLAPWWPLMKKKGLELPEQANHYPELTTEDEDEEEAKPRRGKRVRG